MAGKMAKMVSEVVNSNAAVTTLLGVTFGVLGFRSDMQQKQIEALEEEKVSLLDSNKSMKTAMWEWKQRLYAEASAAGASSVVPLSTLKAIYGDTLTGGDLPADATKSSAPRFMV